MYASEAKKSKVFGSFRLFFKNLGYSRIKIDHKIYHFIADSLLKDAVLTPYGRSQFTPLSSFSVIFYEVLKIYG